MRYKKFMIISTICLMLMVVGLLVLYNHDISTAIGKWVFDGAAEGNYTDKQREIYSNFMIIFILGMPFFAMLIAIINSIRRSMLKKKLEREGRYDEYREIFGKCDN